MHREISSSERLDQGEPPLSLYLLTGLIGLLLAADLWPAFVQWTGWSLPTWPRDLFGRQSFFALVAAVLGGARVLYGSLESLFEGKLGADLALAIACIAAILIGEPLVAAEVVFIGLLGEVLENYTFTRSQKAIRALLEVTPRRCWRLRDGQEERILVSDLKTGDVVVVKPGARIPADGIIREGRASVNTAALTGESLAREKGAGDEVLAGSLIEGGSLTIEATQVAEQTVIGRVLTLTVEALKQKSEVERAADRLARYFLPAVLGLALFTFLVAVIGNSIWARPVEGASKPGLGAAITMATYPALSVLVVACPCALILATPAAILAALGRLAGTGILIKGGASLERLAEVNAFAFDKTGTLTEGVLELADVVPIADVSPDEVLQAAATAEQKSEHLLARIVLEGAAARSLVPRPVEEFQAHPGGGVRVVSNGRVLVVGTRRFLLEQGVVVGDEVGAVLDRLDAAGQTSLLVARDGQVLGAIGARDRSRADAADVITRIRNLGIEDISLLTGDRQAVAEAVAAQLGISDVHAELLPAQKAEIVGREGRRVAFMGDGVNDAPALARAHVGLAVGGTGTEVAAEAGDIVFLSDPLRSLPLLIRLSRETVRIIRQNIILFAFAVNLVGVVLTAWLWPLLAPAGWWYQQSPLVAVLYHQVGSLLVLLNSLRLLWFEKTEPSPRMTAWHGRFDAVNAWMERNLNFDQWLHGLSHHWRKALGGIAVLLVLIYALSGLTQINADEVGVVRRFGRVMEGDLEPGLHWCWPWPIDQVSRVQQHRLRSVEVGFRSVQGARPAVDAGNWASMHGDAIRRYPDESVMITGDDNLIEVLATLHYTIADVRVYLFESEQTEEALRFAVESVLRELVASRAFTPLLTSEGQSLQTMALERLRPRCANLGVKLEALMLQELHPPPEVVASFHGVAQAMEKEQELINQARTEETERLEKGESDRTRVRLIGEVERARLVEEAKTGEKVFALRWKARSTLTPYQDLRLFWETLITAKPNATQEELIAHLTRFRKEELARKALWSDERLRREVLSRTLPGRELMLIDAPPALASLLYGLEQLREALGPILADRLRNPRPARIDEP
jgi:Cu+-exporting ATPase